MDYDLNLARKHNTFGGFCLKANNFAKAAEHLKKALSLCPPSVSFSNVHANLANAFTELKDIDAAIEQYELCIEKSPYARDAELEGVDSSLDAKGAYVQSCCNLAALYMERNRLEQAQHILEKAIELDPESEANINLGNLLRQLGRREEAIQHVWRNVEILVNKEGGSFQQPEQLVLAKHTLPEDHMKGPLHVVCVKWGSKYGPDYVNKLYHGVRKHLTETDFDFTCFTEDGKGLEEGIGVVPLAENWSNWWGKATLFSDHGLEGRLLYIDLDTVITGSLNELARYQGTFAVMSTSDIYCETSKDGVNSSIIAWHSSFGSSIYNSLKRYYKHILKFICRFDHWIEMMVSDPDYVQAFYPGQFLDYCTYCKESLPENCRMICFPRDPKPHECSEPWILSNWQ